jgi:hypothetical protein
MVYALYDLTPEEVVIVEGREEVSGLNLSRLAKILEDDNLDSRIRKQFYFSHALRVAFWVFFALFLTIWFYKKNSKRTG